MSENICGLVAYTDGSSIPHPFQHGAGYGGSGVHGYFYREVGEKERPTKYDGWTATERGYQLPENLNNTELNARPVVVVKYLDAIIPIAGTEVTNNYSELNSAVFILNKALVLGIKKLDILADSKLVIDGINQWMDGWARNGWRTKEDKPVKNVELWLELHQLVRLFREQGEFQINHVRGHNKNLGNEFSDYNASVASQMSKECLGEGAATDYRECSDLKAYQSPEATLHPFLNLKRLYFNNMSRYNENGVYYQTGWNGPEYILGRRSGETTYSVVHIPNGCVPVDSVLKRAEKASPYNIIMYAKLERLRESIVSRYTSHYGGYSFIEDSRTSNLNFLDKKPVVHAVRPGELPLRALDTLRYMHDLLGMFTRGEMQVCDNYCVVDITDRIYERVVKRHGKVEIEVMQLRKEFGVGFTKFDQEEVLFGEKVKLNIQFGDDLPSRNQLKKIEVLNPVISLIAWRETSHFLRYACVISTDEAYGIWSNYFANQIVLKSK